MLEKTLENLLDCKEIQQVHSKGDQSWVFIGRTNFEVETLILWTPDVNSWLIWKDPDTGKEWGQEERGTTEDEMVGWHQQLDGHGFGWTPGAGDGQEGLACCGSWGCKESDTTERLNWTVLNWRKKWDLKTNGQTEHGSHTFTPSHTLKAGKKACCLLALAVSHCSGPSLPLTSQGEASFSVKFENCEGPTQHSWKISSSFFFLNEVLW